MTHQRQRRVPGRPNGSEPQNFRSPPEGRTQLTADKFAVIDALACDSELRCLDRRIGTLLICRYLNSELLRAWPSAELLARDTGADPRSIRRSIKKLIEQGWFTKVRAGGRGKSNRYS